MELIIGLGNPEKKFIGTRHNIGREIIKYFAKILKFSKFKFQKKLEALISNKDIGNKKIILAIPTTYMNESGRAVKKIVDYYKIPIKKITIIHDEIDLPLGKIKLSFDHSSAGHKGVQSIIDNLKTKEFYRLRIGIENRKEKNVPTEKYVLEKFNKKEKKIINEIKKIVCEKLLNN